MKHQAYVVTASGGDDRRVPVGSSLIIGRGAGCDLVIRDLAASRTHLEIRRIDGGFECRDLDSSNGTKVNGDPVDSCELSDGDLIRIGGTSLRFVSEALAEQPPAAEKTVFLQTAVDATTSTEARSTSRSRELLEAAYTLMNSMSSSFNTCELVDRVLETTMEAVRAQRGAVLFAGPGHELRPCPACGRVHTIEEGLRARVELDDVEISESVARQVLVDGKSVLFQSARTDNVVDSTASIAALRLTSILCVPIRTRDEILGILYIDTDLAGRDYTEDDQLLAAAAGNSAGLALDNARIHKDLLAKQRIEQDIEAAWTIQESFLVKDWPTHDPRIEVYGMTRPAKVVGGDFYDFAMLDEDHIGMLIGDVSGKGVPAALTMALLLAEYRLCATGAESTAEVLRRLNERMVARSRRGTFCTTALVAMNLSTGNLVAANAGHHPVMRISAAGVKSELGASGPPLGILEGADWVDEETPVEPGETLLLYTDGIVEARAGTADPDVHRDEDEYGVEGLEMVAAPLWRSSPNELIEAVLADVDVFCSPRAAHDDCTMIALKYHGPDAGKR